MPSPADQKNARALIDKAIIEDSIPSLFSPGGSFESFPGVVIIAGPGAIVLGNNKDAEPVCQTLRSAPHPDLRQAIRSALHGRAAHINPLLLSHRSGDMDVQRAYDMAVLPWAEGAAALLLGRDVTLERSLRASWIDARRRFEDILSLAGDFAWETDAQGSFTFFSQNRVLGFDSTDLLGQVSDELLCDLESVPVNPFSSRDAISYQSFRCFNHQRQAMTLQISAVPIFETPTRWRGARGLVHTITDA
ncbi:MAG: PAS domain-containing protein [Pseudomonadota bacterium]